LLQRMVSRIACATGDFEHTVFAADARADGPDSFCLYVLLRFLRSLDLRAGHSFLLVRLGGFLLLAFSAGVLNVRCAHGYVLTAAASFSARMMANLANGILYALCLSGFAPCMAASAAALKVDSSADFPSNACSASAERHGLV